MSASLRKAAGALLVDDERLTARRVADANVRPCVKLTDDLVKRQIRAHQSPHHGVRRHAGDSDISRAARAVLAGVLGAHAVVDLLGPEGAVHHDWLAVKVCFHFFQKLGQLDQVRHLRIVGRVVELAVAGGGQFFQREVLGQFHLMAFCNAVVLSWLDLLEPK